MTSIRQELRRAVQRGSGPFSCSVEVESVAKITPGFWRVAVRGSGLAEYTEPMPADAFKLMLPPDGKGRVDFPERGVDGIPYWPEGTRRPTLRAYTVRTWDPDNLRLEFDVAVHGSGLAVTWLHAAKEGDVVGLSGMRREFYAGDVDRHLIVGDASALPAVAAIVESLDGSTPVTVYVGAEDERDCALVPNKENMAVYWVLDEPTEGSGSRLERAVRAGEHANGRTQAWLAAEAGVVRELRRHVIGELSVRREDLHAAAYWKAGRDSTQVDAVNLERYKRAVEQGLDITDPDVSDKIEFEH